jgi:cation-transporting ATPase E
MKEQGQQRSEFAMPHVDDSGLSQQEVAERIAAGQLNIVKSESSRSLGQIIRANVFTLFNGIIFVAALVVLSTGQWKDAVFGCIILVNTGIGVLTELRAKQTLDKLSILVESDYVVHRDGQDVLISHDKIVLDDLLWIRAGEQIPADAEIIRTFGLELDESMLTGESRTVSHSEGEQVYSGSVAVSGLALARVNAVGDHGYAAKLTAKAKVFTKTHSDLNDGINKILRAMTFVVVPLCVLLVWTQLVAVGGLESAIATGMWRDAVVSAVAGVVSMIPEGLVLLTSLNFAIAAIRLARQQTLVQELEAVETLARVDALNLDKTGTITDGGIEFSHLQELVEPADRAELEQRLIDVCAEEQPNATAQAVAQGLPAVHPSANVVDRIPFSSARKWSAAVFQDGSQWFMGAPEILMERTAVDAPHEFARKRDDIHQQTHDLAEQGYRVLLLARSDAELNKTAEHQLPDSLIPEALVLCTERIREDASDTLAWFREQGVRCRIISGDNPGTVRSIASTVRLTGDQEPRAMDARELPEDVEELADVLEHVDVLGRVLPEQKKAIVQALHSRNHVVAMTGDGVNDSLALKEADLGVAMGNAAPATKSVAQVVLVDSKFSHLPDVVARGRQVMANMERVAGLFVVKTVYSALISIGVVLSAIPYPYLPRHITYIGSLTIGIPAFLLALAPNVRRYKPGFLKRVVMFALPCGTATGIAVLLTAWVVPAVMGWDLTKPTDLAQLRVVSSMVLFAMGILVLARVARPLRSWRGILVAVFAVAGVIGLFIPVVSNFFALSVPTGVTLLVTCCALVVSACVFMIFIWAAPLIERIFSRRKMTR